MNVVKEAGHVLLCLPVNNVFVPRMFYLILFRFRSDRIP